MKNILVELSNVTKIYNKKIWAIKKINLKIMENECVAFVGPNNGGKTVLGKLIANVEEQSSGSINHNFMNGTVLENVGYQFRDASWPAGFKVRDVIKLYKNIYQISDESWVEEIMSILEINSFVENDLSKCNSNQKQLFSLFLALINKPNLIVIDEISNSIGLDIRTNIVNLLVKCKIELNMTIVLVSPGKLVFDRLCDRIVVINEGLILKDEIISSWEKDKTYEEFLTSSLKEIKDKKFFSKPDPVFKPILKKYENNQDKFLKVLKKIEIDFQQIDNNEDKQLLLAYKNNIVYFLDIFYEQLLYTVSSFISKNNIDDSKSKANVVVGRISTFLKIIKSKKYKQYFKKTNILTTLEIIYNFQNYLKEDLIPLFKNKKIIIDGNEITASLSKSDLKELKLLKKKYIAEELKYIKTESKKSRK